MEFFDSFDDMKKYQGRLLKFRYSQERDSESLTKTLDQNLMQEADPNVEKPNDIDMDIDEKFEVKSIFNLIKDENNKNNSINDAEQILYFISVYFTNQFIESLEIFLDYLLSDNEFFIDNCYKLEKQFYKNILLIEKIPQEHLEQLNNKVIELNNLIEDDLKSNHSKASVSNKSVHNSNKSVNSQASKANSIKDSNYSYIQIGQVLTRLIHQKIENKKQISPGFYKSMIDQQDYLCPLMDDDSLEEEMKKKMNDERPIIDPQHTAATMTEYSQNDRFKPMQKWKPRCSLLGTNMDFVVDDKTRSILKESWKVGKEWGMSQGKNSKIVLQMKTGIAEDLESRRSNASRRSNF